MKCNLHPKGKITFSTIIIMVILFYGGFVAFKFISSRLTQTQLKNEIIEKLGYIRGSDFTIEKGEETIREIMITYGFYVEADESEESQPAAGDPSEKIPPSRIIVQINENGAKIRFRVDYTDVLNLVLFKKKNFITLEAEVTNYN